MRSRHSRSFISNWKLRRVSSKDWSRNSIPKLPKFYKVRIRIENWITSKYLIMKEKDKKRNLKIKGLNQDRSIYWRKKRKNIRCPYATSTHTIYGF